MGKSYEKRIVDEKDWLKVLCRMEEGSIGIVVLSGLKLSDVERVELYTYRERKPGQTSGLAKVWRKDGGMYNLGIRAHLIEWD
jgi:hypothetical protein